MVQQFLAAGKVCGAQQIFQGGHVGQRAQIRAQRLKIEVLFMKDASLGVEILVVRYFLQVAHDGVHLAGTVEFPGDEKGEGNMKILPEGSLNAG